MPNETLVLARTMYAEVQTLIHPANRARCVLRQYAQRRLLMTISIEGREEAYRSVSFPGNRRTILASGIRLASCRNHAPSLQITERSGLWHKASPCEQ